MAFCLQCGAALADGVKFCTECGTPVTEAEIPQDTPQPSAGPGPKLAPGRMFSPKMAAAPAAPAAPRPAPAPAAAAPAPAPAVRETAAPAAAPRTPTNSASAKSVLAAHLNDGSTFTIILSGVDPESKITLMKVVRQVTGLGLKEAKDLVDCPPAILKENLSASEARKLIYDIEAAGGILSAEASGGTGETSTDTNDQPTGLCTVVLKKYNAQNKIALIKEVRGVTGLGLGPAKTLIENVPSVIKTGLIEYEAEQIKKVLASAGGEVVVEQ